MNRLIETPQLNSIKDLMKDFKIELKTGRIINLNRKKRNLAIY